MKIDVIIPVYRPTEKLHKVLYRLCRQTHLPEQIILLHTRDGIKLDVSVCKDRVSVTEIPILEKEFDHGRTREQGIWMSDADIVVMMTQDAVPADEELIEELVRPLLLDEKTGAAYARQLPNKECDVIERYTRAFNYPDRSRIKRKEDLEELGIKTFFCSDVCAAYRRDIYEKMGGFTKKTIFNEDMILAGQMILAGYQVAYAAEARVIHSHNYSGRQQFHRNFDLAVSQTDHPEVFEGIRSESEGIRLVKKTASYLLKIRKPWLIPVLIYKSGCKYLGYKLGQNYRKLPLWIVKFCSMSTTYWGK